MKNLFVIIGESGSGKTTLVKGLTATHKNIELLVTSTSRPIREKEINNIDYNFLSVQEFRELIETKKFIEYTVFRDWYYGLNKETIYNCNSDNMAVVLNPLGLKNLIKYLDNKSYRVIPIYIYASEKIRLKRCLDRDNDIDEILRRFYADRIDFEGITKYVLDNGGYIIKNDYDLETVVDDLQRIVAECLRGNNGQV